MEPSGAKFSERVAIAHEMSSFQKTKTGGAYAIGVKALDGPASLAMNGALTAAAVVGREVVDSAVHELKPLSMLLHWEAATGLTVMEMTDSGASGLGPDTLLSKRSCADAPVVSKATTRSFGRVVFMI